MGEKGGLCKNKIFDFLFLSWETMLQTAVLSSMGKAEEQRRSLEPPPPRRLCAGRLARRTQATRIHVIASPEATWRRLE